ncbi:MAG: polysaccharide deacetylase family protein, partial [Bacteroidota bacterium]
QKKFVPYGYPVFEYDRALSLRRYFPDDRIIDEGQRLFSKYKNQAILSDDSKNKILSTLNNLVQHKYPGYFETDEEMGKRYEYELIESKRILEEKLNKRVEFLCWPGGGYNELALKISKQAGYKVSTLASRESIDNINNTQQYKRLHRFGMGSFIYKNGKRIPAKLSNHLILSFHAKSGNYWAKIPLIIQKILS